MKTIDNFEKERRGRWKLLNKSKEWRELYAKFRHISACNGACNIAMLDMGLALYGEKKFDVILKNGSGYPKLYAKMFRDYISIVRKVGKLQRHLEYKTEFQRPILRDDKEKS
jgi:hypothetical protein